MGRGGSFGEGRKRGRRGLEGEDSSRVSSGRGIMSIWKNNVNQYTALQAVGVKRRESESEVEALCRFYDARTRTKTVPVATALTHAARVGCADIFQFLV